MQTIHSPADVGHEMPNTQHILRAAQRGNLIYFEQFSQSSIPPLISLLVLLFAASGISPVSAQGSQFFKCPEKEYTFSGFPAQTLCEENPNFVCAIQIGTGTLLPKSSLIGASITGNVCIVGDFEVDASFRFQNAVVKIAPGVKISIANSPSASANVTLELDNSKLFACNGLWKGIELGSYAYFLTHNGSEIEDAEKAVYSEVRSALSVQNTTFNRNRVAIELVNSSPGTWDSSPLLWNFTGNHFTCDAPLNGTADEVTYAGVKLKDVLIYTVQGGLNIFNDIQYGIYSEGNGAYIGVQNMVFQRIKRDGIYMEYGYLDLESSQFENCEEKGVNIANAINVAISGNCNFYWDESLPDLIGSNYRDGIYVGSFAASSRMTVEDCSFSSNLSSTFKKIKGINLKGGDVGAGTEIIITGCTWEMVAAASFGVFIQGDFPSVVQIEVSYNDFNVRMASVTSTSYCIYCGDGNIYDLDIIGNFFYNDRMPNQSWPSGIFLEGSEGTDNQVSDNHFESGIYLGSYLCGVWPINFKNTKFCSNTSANAIRSFCFSGQNDGTEFTNNIAYGAQLITISGQSWIEDQDQMGNRWTAAYQGSLLPFVAMIQAECTDPFSAQYSEFFVHTPQSTSYSGIGFNPYHPKNLFPDNDTEWWFQKNGNPAGACIDELTNPGDGDTGFKRAVADGTLAAQLDDSSMTWQAERALYFALKRDTALASTYAAYIAFLAAKSGSNIEKFYQVAAVLDAARNGSPPLVAQAQNNRTAIDNLLVEIKAADQAWQIAATPAEEEAAKNAKQQKLGELTGLLQANAALQTSYKQDLQTALANVQQLNDDITPASNWEAYEKTTNSIFISFLQNGGITEVQKQQLEIIAEVCPKYGGMAVYKARGLLPECAQSFERDNYEGCYPAPEPASLDTLEIESRPLSTVRLQHLASVQATPNPARESVTITIPQGEQAGVRLVHAFGQLVLEQKITSPQTTFSVSLLPAGIYFLEVMFADGQRECLKLVVSK